MCLAHRDGCGKILVSLSVYSSPTFPSIDPAVCLFVCPSLICMSSEVFGSSLLPFLPPSLLYPMHNIHFTRTTQFTYHRSFPNHFYTSMPSHSPALNPTLSFTPPSLPSPPDDSISPPNRTLGILSTTPTTPPETASQIL